MCSTRLWKIQSPTRLTRTQPDSPLGRDEGESLFVLFCPFSSPTSPITMSLAPSTNLTVDTITTTFDNKVRHDSTHRQLIGDWDWGATEKGKAATRKRVEPIDTSNNNHHNQHQYHIIYYITHRRSHSIDRCRIVGVAARFGVRSRAKNSRLNSDLTRPADRTEYCPYNSIAITLYSCDTIAYMCVFFMLSLLLHFRLPISPSPSSVVRSWTWLRLKCQV